jgi:zinc/manganese transport system substrate-binding protein
MLLGVAVLATVGLWSGPRGVLAASAGPAEKKTIVVSSSVLHALVADMVGDRFQVRLAIPNGVDLHDWEPSAKDIAALTRADLLVVNGLGLEAGMQRSIARAKASGVRLFVAADHVTVRKVGHGEEPPSGSSDHDHDGHDGHDHDHGRDSHGHGHGHGGHDHGGFDPHLWTDPIAMKAVAAALAAQLQADFGVDLSLRLADVQKRLDALDEEVRRSVAALPPERRKLVTGHESLGYFAQRYGFELVGAVVPSLSTEAESTAAGVADLKKVIARHRVKVIFTEVGTPERVAEVLSREAGVRCVPLWTHAVPADGSYFSFLRALARTITDSLQ